MWLFLPRAQVRGLVFFAAPMVARLCMSISPIITTMNITTLWQKICLLIPLLMPWKKFQPDPPYTPQSENKWHADIVLPVIVATDKQARERHAHQLADMSIPRPAANPT